MGLDIIIVLASMIYSLVLDTFKLHPNDKKKFNGFRNRNQISNIMHIKWLLFPLKTIIRSLSCNLSFMCQNLSWNF
jgi:hypothetical protein